MGSPTLLTHTSLINSLSLCPCFFQTQDSPAQALLLLTRFQMSADDQESEHAHASVRSSRAIPPDSLPWQRALSMQGFDRLKATRAFGKQITSSLQCGRWGATHLRFSDPPCSQNYPTFHRNQNKSDAIYPPLV